MATFAERLKELRKEKGLTQKELADTFFITKSSICKYETGVNSPENKLLQNLAEYFNVSVDYLLGNSSIEQDMNSEIQKKYDEISKAFAKKGISLEDMNPSEFEDLLDLYMAVKKIKKD